MSESVAASFKSVCVCACVSNHSTRGREGRGPGDLTSRDLLSFAALTNGLISGGLIDILESLPILDILKLKGGTSGGLLGNLLGTLTSGIPLLNNIIE